MLKPGRPDYSALALVGQLGLAATVPIVAGVAGGIFLRDRVGGALGGLLLAVCTLAGVAGAVVAVYRVVAPYLD